jgi:hypothetical protein
MNKKTLAIIASIFVIVILLLIGSQMIVPPSPTGIRSDGTIVQK